MCPSASTCRRARLGEQQGGEEVPGGAGAREEAARAGAPRVAIRGRSAPPSVCPTGGAAAAARGCMHALIHQGIGSRAANMRNCAVTSSGMICRAVFSWSTLTYFQVAFLSSRGGGEGICSGNVSRTQSVVTASRANAPAIYRRRRSSISALITSLRLSWHASYFKNNRSTSAVVSSVCDLRQAGQARVRSVMMTASAPVYTQLVWR